MTELEDLGRYHQALDRIAEAARRRNCALMRAGTVMLEAGKPPINRHALARGCRFDAVDRLVEEARAAQADMDQLLALLAVLGPIVGKAVPELE